MTASQPGTAPAKSSPDIDLAATTASAGSLVRAGDERLAHAALGAIDEQMRSGAVIRR